MKSLNSFVTLIILTFSTFSASARPQITNIEIMGRQYGMKDLYATNVSQIALKLTRDNGSVRYTKGLATGTVSWNRITITSDQAEVRGGWLKVYRKNLIDNNYVINLNIKVYNGNQIFTKTIDYKLPRIQEISIHQNTIVPYTRYPKLIIIKTTKKTYTVTPDSKLAGFKYDDFKWTFLSTLIHETYSNFTFRPMESNNPSNTSLRLSNERLGYDSLFNFKITPLEKFELSFNGRRGKRGASGSSGYDGDTGQDGDDGGDGDMGYPGEPGHDVELLIAKKSNNISVLFFARDSVTEYLLPLACKFILNSKGGKGGAGGYGGSGGSGGGEDSEGNCGSDGISGDTGPGGGGGNGGGLKIYSDLPIDLLATLIKVNNDGGAGGNGYSNGPRGMKGSVEYIILTTQEITNMRSELID